MATSRHKHHLTISTEELSRAECGPRSEPPFASEPGLPSKKYRVNRYMNRRVLLLSTLLLFGMLDAAAQQDLRPFPGSTRRGNGIISSSTISGSVRSVDDRPVREARIEVRLLGSGELVASGYTLPNGTFELSNVPRGSYEVVATVGVQESRERVDIDRPGASVLLRLPVGGTDPGGSSGSAMVSVSQLKVPDKARKLFAKAQEAFHKEKLQEAHDQLEKALQAFPNYAQALTLRGLLALQDNKVDQARTDLEQAIKSDYGYAMAYVVLGATYNLMNRYDDSMRVLERSIALTPASWQAYFEMSKALLGKGQYEAALRQVNKASELAPPKYAAVHLIKAHALLGLKNYDQAVSELEQFIGTDPTGADSASARQTLDQVKAFMAKKQ
jgi:tetratricopeptide (TPR) repeat protein